MPGEDPLLRLRPEFPIHEKATCLISNSLGAMPRAAARALAESAFTGWMAHQAPFSFEPPPRRHREDAYRILQGAPAIDARDVAVDYRPGAGIRMSPHFDTEDCELDSAFEEIDEILETGAWKRWEGRGGLGT